MTYSQKVILIGSLDVYPMTVLSASGDSVGRHGWGLNGKDWSWSQKQEQQLANSFLGRAGVI